MIDNDVKDIVFKFKSNVQKDASWEEFRTIYGNKDWQQLDQFLTILRKEITKNDWNEIIDALKLEYPEIQDTVVAIGKNYDNGATISDNDNSTWQTYKQSLVQKKWSKKSIANLQNSSLYVLRKLAVNQEFGNRKGLVIGNVQSGKTANMTGLMAQAADNGFNYFIILSGTIESLRKQTENRFMQDLASKSSNIQFTPVSNPSLRGRGGNNQIDTFNFSSDSHKAYFSVCLKNKSRLKSLYNWITSNKDKQRQMKVILIDDEADQASINTKDVNGDERTTINELVRKFANNHDFGAMNYIAYTATPFANVLNENGEDSLYPRDFIQLLEPAEDYIGPKEIFGTENPEYSPGVDIVQNIPQIDVSELRNTSDKVLVPKSLKRAVNWFLISLAAMRSYGYKKPISMMVHTSFRVSDHQKVASAIATYLSELRVNINENLVLLEKQYLSQQRALTLERFKLALSNYTRDEIQDYPAWKNVETELKHLLLDLPNDQYVSHIKIADNGMEKYGEGIHLCIDNSRAKDTYDETSRLIYPTDSNMPSKAPGFIVVGGNTLSRGLTIQGLVSTYFIRSTNQADTLMQMARWFGYRQGYELFPRVWLDELAIKRYTFLSQMNEEMRGVMGAYANNNITPLEFYPKIKQSPSYSLIRITSANKMQSAVPTEFDFAGINTQTIAFDNDEEILKENIQYTDMFLCDITNSGITPTVKDKGHIVWRGVNWSFVEDYLTNYHYIKYDNKISNLSNIINWLSDNDQELKEWNVIVAGRKTDDLKFGWKIGKYNVGKVIRTRKSGDDLDIINIGALRSPNDLVADIDDLSYEELKNSSSEAMMRSIRNRHGVGDIPQLLIYRIDKNSKPKLNNSNRYPLDAKEDIIGINIMLPGRVGNKTNHTTYISIKPADLIDEIGEDVEG